MISPIKSLIYNIICNLQSNHSVQTNTYIHVDNYFTISLLINNKKNLRFDIMKLNQGVQFTMGIHSIDVYNTSDEKLVLDIINTQLPHIKEISQTIF